MSKVLMIKDTEIELHAFEEISAESGIVFEVLVMDASFAEGGDKIICKFSINSKGEILTMDDKHPIPEWLNNNETLDMIIKEVLSAKKE